MRPPFVEHSKEKPFLCQHSLSDLRSVEHPLGCEQHVAQPFRTEVLSYSPHRKIYVQSPKDSPRHLKNLIHSAAKKFPLEGRKKAQLRVNPYLSAGRLSKSRRAI